nr:hypothetical protein GCM10020063_047050 [Dactylosporangium thailandense]
MAQPGRQDLFELGEGAQRGLLDPGDRAGGGGAQADGHGDGLVVVEQQGRQRGADLAETAPHTLRKGPRGGGRDRDEIVTHVGDNDRAYARKIGIRHRPFAAQDRTALAALRAAVLDALGNPAGGGPLTGGGWPPAYAARRFAWHVLDHVWEIQDRS